MFAVFDKVTGRLFSVGSKVADPLPSKFDYKEIDHNVGQVWDEELRDFREYTEAELAEIEQEDLADGN